MGSIGGLDGLNGLNSLNKAEDQGLAVPSSDIEVNIRKLENTQAKINAALEAFRSMKAGEGQLHQHTVVVFTTFCFKTLKIQILQSQLSHGIALFF